MGAVAYNLGSGKGTSVLEMIKAFEEGTGISIPYKVGPRREGDVPIYVAKVDKAWNELQWKVKRSVVEACTDGWKWQNINPNGYGVQEEGQPRKCQCFHVL